MSGNNIQYLTTRRKYYKLFKFNINTGFDKYKLNNSFHNYTKEEINTTINKINSLYL